MTIRPEALRGGGAGSSPGVVDHRLARRFLIAEYRRGRLAQHQVCDAHPELIRAANEVGTETSQTCPICELDRLVHVTYVFGPRLPAHGRCISRPGELAALNKRPSALTAYVVEACRSCSWHHLVSTVPVGKGWQRPSGTTPG